MNYEIYWYLPKSLVTFDLVDSDSILVMPQHSSHAVSMADWFIRVQSIA